ncbi:MAG: hypothetical protein ACLFQ0_10285 [Cyclobacteriaceae bacterium]
MDFTNLSHWFTALYYTVIVFVTYLLIRGRIFFDLAIRYMKQQMREKEEDT